MSAIQNNLPVALPQLPQPQAPTVDSIVRLKNLILESAQISPPELPKKIAYLRSLSSNIAKLRNDCRVLAMATTAKVERLPFYDIVKIVDKFVDNFGFLNCLCGDIGKEREVVAQATEDLDACIARITRRELSQLAAMDAQSVSAGIDTVHAYTLIGSLDPNQTAHLEGLADHLFKSKAYTAASTTYALYCEKNPDHKNVKPKAILALAGAKNYQIALDEISKAKVTLFPPDPKNVAIRAHLDMVKASCLIELKQYNFAREALLELLTAQPSNDKIKEKLVSLAIEEALFAFEQAPRDDAGIFAKAKAMFAAQESKHTLAWTNDCLIADFRFWLLAASTLRVSSNKKLYDAILGKIDEFLKSRAVTPKTLLETFKTKVSTIHVEASSFLDTYLKFAKETFKDIPEAALPLVEAQKTTIKEIIFGDDRLNGSSGLQQNLDTLRIVYKQLIDSKLFDDSESKTALREIEALLQQTNNAIQTCKDSLVKTIQDGSHPYINRQSLPFLQIGAN